MRFYLDNVFNIYNLLLSDGWGKLEKGRTPVPLFYLFLCWEGIFLLNIVEYFNKRFPGGVHTHTLSITIRSSSISLFAFFFYFNSNYDGENYYYLIIMMVKWKSSCSSSNKLKLNEDSFLLPHNRKAHPPRLRIIECLPSLKYDVKLSHTKLEACLNYF